MVLKSCASLLPMDTLSLFSSGGWWFCDLSGEHTSEDAWVDMPVAAGKPRFLSRDTHHIGGAVNGDGDAVSYHLRFHSTELPMAALAPSSQLEALCSLRPSVETRRVASTPLSAVCPGRALVKPSAPTSETVQGSVPTFLSLAFGSQVSSLPILNLFI